MRQILALCAVFIIGVACGQKPDEAPPRSATEQRAVDSTVGASRLPGAQGVQGALRATDSAAARQKLLDSLSQNP